WSFMEQISTTTSRQWMIVDCCCFALCCLPVFTCKVTSAVGACPCLPLLDCIGCVPPASLAMRASVRQRYGIQKTSEYNMSSKKCHRIIFHCTSKSIVIFKTVEILICC
uniref:PLAC8 like 1 n=1 Tax=Amphiprion percula TaxID=161767 RepID=A0A3P8TMY3_AMPPE